MPHRDNIGVCVYTGHWCHIIDNIGVYVYTGHWCYIIDKIGVYVYTGHWCHIEITLVYMFILDTDVTP